VPAGLVMTAGVPATEFFFSVLSSTAPTHMERR
jgi:hypothetical protein